MRVTDRSTCRRQVEASVVVGVARASPDTAKDCAARTLDAFGAVMVHP